MSRARAQADAVGLECPAAPWRVGRAGCVLGEVAVAGRVGAGGDPTPLPALHTHTPHHVNTPPQALPLATSPATPAQLVLGLPYAKTAAPHVAPPAAALLLALAALLGFCLWRILRACGACCCCRRCQPPAPAPQA